MNFLGVFWYEFLKEKEEVWVLPALNMVRTLLPILNFLEIFLYRLVVVSYIANYYIGHNESITVSGCESRGEHETISTDSYPSVKAVADDSRAWLG